MMLDMEELTHRVIGMAIEIHRTLGSGYAQSLYHSAMIVELTAGKVPFESKKQLDVFYKGVRVGHFEADIVIFGDKRLLIEFEAVEKLLKSHEVQLVNDLSASGIEDGLLLNFGSPTLEIKRKFKPHRPSARRSESPT